MAIAKKYLRSALDARPKGRRYRDVEDDRQFLYLTIAAVYSLLFVGNEMKG